MTITKDMTIAQAIEVDNRIAGVFMAFGMGCIGCAMASGETIEEACGVHGIEVEELMTAVNEFIAQNAK